MENLAATISFVDESVPVILTPALKTMAGGPLQQLREYLQINLIGLIDSATLEPALYHNPYFVLPSTQQQDVYLSFLEALRQTDQYLLATLAGYPEQCLIYPYRDYLMLVLITSTVELREPEKTDWAANMATLSEQKVVQLRAKLEHLNQPALKARSTTTL